ncbi:MAG: DEAD/DEAH box helicase, partial [Dehalococcoidia bacterium]
MDVSAVVEGLRRLPEYGGQIVHLEQIPAREARYAEPEGGFHPVLAGALERLGLLPLFQHQAQAIESLRAGADVMVATPAASGKSLIYNAATLDYLLREQGTRALYLFPTKALAQDQWRALRELLDCHPQLKRLRVATFDGDTPGDERGEIRRSAQVLLTNPDMLHLGILPNHRSWTKLLGRLRYVVIDEAHIYRGVFGSHVANVLRRLRRLCQLHGSSPQFILCSGTIANPGQHAEALVGRPFDVIIEDGSPSSRKDFVFWNPPIIDRAKSARRSANTEATLLFTHLVSMGIRTLTFARTRRVAELIYMYARNQLRVTHPGLARRIMPYRAGYLPEERRRIERGLFDGSLLGVCATNALELGIDIGDLDATVLTGYPGSIASAWQQAGRSGRRGHRSFSFLIGLDNPLDQYFMRHPGEFFDKPHEHALISPSNPYVLRPHLLCAAYEWPLASTDEALFGEGFPGQVKELEEQGLLKSRRGRRYLSTEVSYPAQDVNIRSTSSQSYVIVVEGSGTVLETVEAATAFFQIHPGAVYLHQGDPYLISDLDLDSRVARARPADVNYYTQTMDITDIRVIEVRSQRRVGSGTAYLGWVKVSTTVVGFKRKAQVTEEVLSEEALDLPPLVFETSALWFDIPGRATEGITRAGLDFAGGLHAAEHAAIGILPIFALCDRNDIGGLSTPLHPDTGQPQVFIYDGHPGGIGITEKGYELMEELWRATLRTLAECPCEAGCPSCVQSPKCGNNNEP